MVFYDSKGTFIGVRRPDSGKPIEVRRCMGTPFQSRHDLVFHESLAPSLARSSQTTAVRLLQVFLMILDFCFHKMSCLTAALSDENPRRLKTNAESSGRCIAGLRP